MTRSIFFWFFTILCCSVSPTYAEENLQATLALQSEFGAKRDWHLTVSQTAAEEPVKLCFWVPLDKKAIDCAEDKVRVGYEDVWPTNHIERLRILSNPHLVALTTRFFSDGSSGWMSKMQFWRYSAESDQFLPAGTVTFTEQGEYKLDGDILYVANAYWGGGETHFSRHQFYVTAYRYTSQDGFTKLFEYLTRKKYPSFDETDKIDVISHEMPTIKSLTR